MAAEDGPDQVTEVTETSWLRRMGQSFAGVAFGFILIVAACVLIFVNEGNAVKTARSLAEGAGLVQAVPIGKVDPANEGKLVHVMGMLSAGGPATDNEFGMKSAGVRLVRRVEMFQWVQEEQSETDKKLGGGTTTKTTYKYSKEWADHPVDSSKFKERTGHSNPQMTYRNRFAVAAQPKLGAFAVPSDLLGNFGAETALPITDEQLPTIQKRLNKPMQVVDGVLYVSLDPNQPTVGDFRVSFSEVKLQPASIVAAQVGAGLGPYRTKAGRNIELIESGEVPADAMFKDAQADNRLWAWIFRGVLVVAMFIGFCLIMGPLGTLADLIPLLGDVVRVGTGFIAFLGTVLLAPLMIAIAWFVYRPVVAAITLVVGAALAYGVIHWSRARRAASKTATAT